MASPTLYTDAARHLKMGARFQDETRLKLGLQLVKDAGLTSREAYRIALAGDPTLTLHEWADIVIRAGVTLP